MASCKQRAILPTQFLPFFTAIESISVISNEPLVFVQRQPVKQGQNAEDDVRGPVSSGPIPQSDTEPVRLAVRRTMKQLSGPYSAFDQYYPLEDAIELYNEIWYESSSSDE